MQAFLKGARQPIAERTTEERLGFIDGLRCAATLMVFVTHCRERGFIGDTFPLLRFDVPLPVALAQGGLGVTVFFFISGFVIFLPFARHLVEGSARPSWAHFSSRRFWKIVPLYILLLTVFSILTPDGVPPGGGWLHFAAHALFVHSFLPETFLSIDGPMWSLAVEVQFYVTFPLLCLVLLRNVWLGTALMAAGALFYRTRLALIGDNSFFTINQYVGHLDTLAAGILCAYLYVKLRRLPRSPAGLAVATAVSLGGAVATYALFAAAGAAGGGYHEWAWERDHRALLSLAVLALALGGLFAVPAWQAIFANPLTRGVAIVSYALYLVHGPVLEGIDVTLGPHYQTLPRETLPYTAILLSFAAAIALTYLYERPLMRAGPRLVTRLRRRFAKGVPRIDTPQPHSSS